MCNGAVFIPLIDEIDTIEPGLPGRLQFRRDRLAHEEHRLEVLLEQRPPVRPGHPGRRHPGVRRGAAGDVDQSVQLTVGAAFAAAIAAAMPSSVRGIGRDRHDRKALRDHRLDVRVEVLRRAAHRDDGRAGLGDHARHGRADAAAGRAGDDDDAPVKREEVLAHLDSACLPQRQDATFAVGGDVQRAVRSGGDAGEQALRPGERLQARAAAWGSTPTGGPTGRSLASVCRALLSRLTLISTLAPASTT